MKKYSVFMLILVICVLLFLNIQQSSNGIPKKNDAVVTALPTSLDTVAISEDNSNNTGTANTIPPQNTQEGVVLITNFKNVTLNSDKPMDELGLIVGLENVDRILALNRIDKQIVKKGKTIVVPVDSTDGVVDYFMPQKLNSLVDVQKAVIIYQRTQAFGFYENGLLVRSGPVSSGRKNSPTPSGLYFTNWKGKRVISTVDDSWILKWNFNIDNENGIGIHQYVLPGYPDSHSCVRVTEEDAIWLYNWADQWILDETGHNKLANGTPVIVYGEYDFETIAPWKDLVNNSKATFIDESELDAGISIYKDRIVQEQMYRENVILNKNTTNEIQNQ